MLATAVDLGTTLVFEPSDRVCVTSANYDGIVEFDPTSVSQETVPPGWPPWGIFVWASYSVLADRLGPKPRGFRGQIDGALPGAGLSSSASVMLALLTAWTESNGVELSPRERVELAVTAENDHVGVACGVLDPAAIVGSRAGALLEIDADRIEWDGTPLGASGGTGSPRFLICFTGRERSLAETPYNTRVTECFEAARHVAHLHGIDGVRRLGDLDRALLRDTLDALPDAFGRRARHFLGECERVEAGRRAWAEGDLVRFGELMHASCRSSIDCFEVGSEELIRLQDIWESTAGVLGARFSGGGFGGCSLALVEEDRVEDVKKDVVERFRRAFPELAGRARLVEVTSADGLRIE